MTVNDIAEVKAAKVAIIGVGGGGNNAVNRIIMDSKGEESMKDVLFVAMNTDYRVLENSLANIKIALGERTTGGYGCGAKPEVGKAAAEESAEQISAVLDGIDMVFITAGMGGGTGTGAAPVVAAIAKKKGILTVGVVTKPFTFEGRQKMKAAEAGVERLKASVDSLVVIPNTNVFKLIKDRCTVQTAFGYVDCILSNSVKGICDIITKRGEVNIDFADITTVMKNRGIVHMGVGYAKGENRFQDALSEAIKNPLLETSIAYAKEVILNFYGDNIDVYQMNECSAYIAENVDPDAEIIWGYREPENPDAEEKDFVQVTVIATQFETPMGGSSSNEAPDFSAGNLGKWGPIGF